MLMWGWGHVNFYNYERAAVTGRVVGHYLRKRYGEHLGGSTPNFVDFCLFPLVPIPHLQMV